MSEVNLFSPSDDVLKELFALFSSPSKLELESIYDLGSDGHFSLETLSDEYELCQAKREFAIDAWRASLYWLYKNGYSLEKNGEVIPLSPVVSLFV